MTVQTQPFTVGDFQCIAINDGDLKMGPTSIFFAGASPHELDSALKQYNLASDGLNLACSCLYINTGKEQILIDCGSGADSGHEQLGKLFAALEQADISTENITHVLLSHGHWDHVGGCSDNAGNLRFSNARFAMVQGEYDFWMNETPDSDSDTLHMTQIRLKAINPHLDFIDINEEILSGVRAIETPGHTMHHISFEISSNGETLICIMDLMDHPLQVEYPQWGAEWDIDHQKSIESREAILKLATEKDALIHGFHFPFPGLGRISQKDDKNVWVALVESEN